MCCSNIVERKWRYEEDFDVKQEDTGFWVCPVEFRPCFGSIFPHHPIFLPFWIGNEFSYVLEICDAFIIYFDLTGGCNEDIAMSLRDFEPQVLNNVETVIDNGKLKLD